MPGRRGGSLDSWRDAVANVRSGADEQSTVWLRGMMMGGSIYSATTSVKKTVASEPRPQDAPIVLSSYDPRWPEHLALERFG
jgi:hypothetical protein